MASMQFSSPLEAASSMSRLSPPIPPESAAKPDLLLSRSSSSSTVIPARSKFSRIPELICEIRKSNRSKVFRINARYHNEVEILKSICYSSSPGSRSPERVPMTTPPSGVSPIDVSTDLPCCAAVTEQPLPRWQVIRRKSCMSFSRYFAAT